jgi:heat shock protein HslJ
MKKIITILFSLLIFLTISTNAQNSLKGDWQLVSMIDENSVEVSLPERLEPSVNFENSSVRARFCNNIAGKYTLKKQKIKIKITTSTMMYCRELETEHLFTKLLGSATAFSVKKDELTLTGNKGKSILKFRKKGAEKAVSLNGRWQLASMILDKDMAIPLTGKPITLNIETDKIGGSGGCNSYGGSFMQAEDTVEFSDIISTKMWCANAPTENKYFQALEKSVLFELSGSELVLMDANKQNILKFTKKK